MQLIVKTKIQPVVAQAMKQLSKAANIRMAVDRQPPDAQAANNRPQVVQTPEVLVEKQPQKAVSIRMETSIVHGVMKKTKSNYLV
jgi:hypothetical protein